jgi:hypothetical protein
MHRLPILGHLCLFQGDWFAADRALHWCWGCRHDGRRSNALVRSLRVPEGIRVFLGEECHSDSDFFLIFFYERLQKGNEVLNPSRIFFVGYVATEFAHEIGVVHVSGPLPKQGSLIQRRIK